MFAKKKIKLHNGKTVTLYLTPYLEQDIIVAMDSIGNIVAKSAFSICCTFSQNAEQENAGKRMIKLGKHIAEEKGFDGRFVRLEYDGKSAIYHLEKTECELLHIEILHEKYFKVGLGSAMFKEIEQIAQENGCQKIYAYYHPFQKFSSGAAPFYERNGFQLVKNSVTGKTIATKELPKTKAGTISHKKALTKQDDSQKSKI